MDVDKGKGRAVQMDPGTAMSHPGTAVSDPGTSQQQLSADVVMAISDFVDSISAGSGTSQCMPVMTRSMRARPRPEPHTPMVEQSLSEDPMSVDQPDTSEDPMSIDDQAPPEEPMSSGIQVVPE